MTPLLPISLPYLLRLVVLALLVVGTFIDWKRESLLRQTLQSKNLTIELLMKAEHVRKGSPIADGRFYVDRIDAGKSIWIAVGPFDIPPAAERREPPKP